MYNSSRKIIISNIKSIGTDEIYENLQNFETYIKEAGWEDWMDNYTENKEYEEITEQENEKIENMQAEKFIKKLDTEKQFIKTIHDSGYKEIAKQIRKDLKNTYGKDFKFSVIKEQYTGGGSININILKGNIDFYTPEYKKIQKLNDYNEYEKFRESRQETYTQEGKKFLKDIRIIHHRYNHYNSDPMTDYHDVNYYGEVKIDQEYINIKTS